MSAAKKPTGRKTSGTRSAPKKTAAKKSTAKKTPKKTAAKKSTAKKTTAAKRTAARGTGAKKTTKKSAPKKTAAKKSTAKKTPAKKTPAKKTAPKGTAKKTSAKKTSAKPTAKKSTAKAPAKKTTAKTASPRTGTTQRSSGSRSGGPRGAGTGTRPAGRAGGRAVKPAKFDRKELATIRKQLEQERVDLLAQQAELEQDVFDGTQSDLTGEVGLDDDFADAGTATFERERDLSIQNNIRDLVDQITRAIARIDEGAYGICERCGRPIDEARLKALPHALLCLDCKRREERAR